jgi:site-specific recombinase XerD
VAAQVPPPALPDGAAWAPDLPSGVRQASLAFMQRRLPNYAPAHRRVRGLHLLAGLRRFWDWLLRQRTISQPSDVRLGDLQAYQQQCTAAGKANQTINDVLHDVLALLRELAEQGQPIDASVFRWRPLPHPVSLPRHLGANASQILEQSVRARAGSADPEVRLENACFWVLAHTGLRASECVDLQVEDCDLTGQRLMVRQGKGGRDRLVYLSATACQALQCYLPLPAPPAGTPLFVRPTGAPITYHWLLTRITALGEAAGVGPVTPHRLRHTLATRLLNAGMDITRIQRLLGHQHLDTTLIYARIADTTVQADFQRAMHAIEQDQLPLANTPVAVPDWPTASAIELLPVADLVYIQLDNSV